MFHPSFHLFKIRSHSCSFHPRINPFALLSIIRINSHLPIMFLLRVYVYLSIHQSITTRFLFVYFCFELTKTFIHPSTIILLSIYSFTYQLPTHLSIHPSTHPSIYLVIYPLTLSSTHLSIFLLIYPLNLPSSHPSFYSFIHPSIHFATHQPDTTHVCMHDFLLFFTKITLTHLFTHLFTHQPLILPSSWFSTLNITLFHYFPVHGNLNRTSTPPPSQSSLHTSPLPPPIQA